MDYQKRVDSLLGESFPIGAVATCDVGGRQVFLLKVMKKVGSNFHEVLYTVDRPDPSPGPVASRRKPQVATIPGDAIVSISTPDVEKKKAKAKTKAKVGGVVRDSREMKDDASAS